VLIWFGIIVAMNLQTSFLTPPFGFALFYLRSVAPRSDHPDRVTGKTIGAVTTPQIYKGALAFIAIQLVMVALVVMYPGIAIDTARRRRSTSTRSSSRRPRRAATTRRPLPALPTPGGDGKAAAEPARQQEAEDPMEAVRRALQDDAKK